MAAVAVGEADRRDRRNRSPTRSRTPAEGRSGSWACLAGAASGCGRCGLAVGSSATGRRGMEPAIVGGRMTHGGVAAGRIGLARLGGCSGCLLLGLVGLADQARGVRERARGETVGYPRRR